MSTKFLTAEYMASLAEVSDDPHMAASIRHLAQQREELLDALKLITEDHQFCGDRFGDRRSAWIETALAAIAKATGEAISAWPASEWPNMNTGYLRGADLSGSNLFGTDTKNAKEK